MVGDGLVRDREEVQEGDEVVGRRDAAGRMDALAREHKLRSRKAE
jgi:hypothetical protein